MLITFLLADWSLDRRSKEADSKNTNFDGFSPNPKKLKMEGAGN